MVLVVSGFGVEHHDRVGIEILALARADGKVWCRIATEAGKLYVPGGALSLKIDSTALGGSLSKLLLPSVHF